MSTFKTEEQTSVVPLGSNSAANLIRTVTSGTFNSVVMAGEGPIVVEFMSYGCSHCQTIEPILRRLAEKMKGQETFFRVNVAVEQELASAFEIQGTPTLMMFLGGKQVGRVEGPSPTVSGLLETLSEAFGT